MVGDVGIQLRRSNAGVAEQLLEETYVYASLKQLSGGRVAQHVGRHAAS